MGLLIQGLKGISDFMGKHRKRQISNCFEKMIPELSGYPASVIYDSGFIHYNGRCFSCKLYIDVMGNAEKDLRCPACLEILVDKDFFER